MRSSTRPSWGSTARCAVAGNTDRDALRAQLPETDIATVASVMDVYLIHILEELDLDPAAGFRYQTPPAALHGRIVRVPVARAPGVSRSP